MGHILLGCNLPHTRKFNQIVALIAGGAGAAQIANAVVSAVEKELGLAARDTGVIETIWLLMQLPLAARSENFSQALYDRGVLVSDSPGLMEIVGGVTDAIDAKMPNCKGRSDLGEMAQMAAAETLTEVIGSRTNNFFGTTTDDVRQAISKLATAKQFSLFAKDFFSRFTNKCLDYFLSRVMTNHVGEGKRFTTMAQQSEFSKAMGTHCRETSRIVETYSGEWFSKHNWETQGEYFARGRDQIYGICDD